MAEITSLIPRRMIKIACDLTTVKCTKDAKMLKPRVQAVVTASCCILISVTTVKLRGGLQVLTRGF